MSRSLHDLCTMSLDEEERVVEQRVEATIRAALARPGNTLRFVESREKAAELAGKVQHLEAQRHQPHTWELLHVLATTRAARALLLWRLFPINNLPVEILEHILSLAVFSPSAAEVSRTRMALVSVCSYWRSVAINTPQLWSIIPITTLPPFHLPLLCLQRAKAHPLVLFIDQRDRNWTHSENDYLFGPDNMRLLMTCVSSFMDQVRQLFILTDTWAVALAALEVLQSTPPPRLLDRLEIHRTGNAYVEFHTVTPPRGIHTPYKLFKGAQVPLLDHVCFNGVHIDFGLATFRNLRAFELRKMAVEHMPTLEDFIPVLEGSPQLQKLVFDGACPQLSRICADDGIQWRPIQLKNLRELTIGNLVPDYAMYILKLIAAPDLRRLTLEKLVNEDFTPFVEKLSGLFPKVTVLTVNGLGTKDTEVLIAWLRTLPKLRYLRFSRVADEFLDAFLHYAPVYPVDDAQPEPRRSIIGARLEVAEILRCSTVNMQAFERFCTGRTEMKAPLRRILVPKGELDGSETPEEVWLRNTGVLSRVPPGSRPDLSHRYDTD
ncbi:hypothetical protein M0805_000909 [Coniferiporia weirii]|nr:hypothetical protein M0805_000909 [Coniferiporia weirii]